MNHIGQTLECKHRDLLELRIDDPVFGDAGLSVFLPLDFQVALTAVGADDFDDQISALGELLAEPGLVLGCDEDQIGLAVFSLPELHLVSGNEHRSQSPRRDKGLKSPVKK